MTIGQGIVSALRVFPDAVGSVLENVAVAGYYITGRTIDARRFARSDFAKYSTTVALTGAAILGTYLYLDGGDSVTNAYKNKFLGDKVEVKCVDIGAAKDCNYLQTPAYDVIYKLEKDENGKVHAVELKKDSIESILINGNVVMHNNGRALQPSQSNDYKVVCKKFGDLGKKCDILESKENSDLIYVPVLKYSGRLDRIESYDMRAVGVEADLNRPGLIKLTDLRNDEVKKPSIKEQVVQEKTQKVKKIKGKDAPRHVEVRRVR